ncbi:hypothetical protein F5876DRAFT_78794 [Lentinula aff. lateritia]|uniref:Uncharacterized protein n=1 Tax=Lentinula aff. lateritia TaxID=2804960 RepID=A0ACC1TUB5_9AGAR|nr:hypothetical protein F5876DRAFT_78794 [Lentinula aff. lateritia]
MDVVMQMSDTIVTVSQLPPKYRKRARIQERQDIESFIEPLLKSDESELKQSQSTLDALSKTSARKARKSPQGSSSMSPVEPRRSSRIKDNLERRTQSVQTFHSRAGCKRKVDEISMETGSQTTGILASESSISSNIPSSSLGLYPVKAKRVDLGYRCSSINSNPNETLCASCGAVVCLDGIAGQKLQVEDSSNIKERPQQVEVKTDNKNQSRILQRATQGPRIRVNSGANTGVNSAVVPPPPLDPKYTLIMRSTGSLLWDAYKEEHGEPPYGEIPLLWGERKAGGQSSKSRGLR